MSYCEGSTNIDNHELINYSYHLPAFRDANSVFRLINAILFLCVCVWGMVIS